MGQSRKWMILIAVTWVQAFTGTNFDFSSYSSTMKSVLGISQVQLNYLSVASDMGKALGWCCGVCLMYLPLWVVLFIATFMGLLGYGLQWLVIKQLIVLPYFLVFLLCLLAGCSICWFNTVCYVSCIQNFPAKRALALSLAVGFNGVSAALYTLIAKAIDPNDDTIYLFLNSIVPIFPATLALIPILWSQTSPSVATHRDSSIFLILNIVAVMSGLYLIVLNPLSSTASNARFLLAGAIILLFLPLCLPGIVYARDWSHRTILNNFHFDNSSFYLAGVDDFEVHEDLDGNDGNNLNGGSCDLIDKGGCIEKVIEKDVLTIPGEEHTARSLVHNWDFWLYYLAYFCGGTIGLVYSNNLGQIAQSLGYHSQLHSLITLYSTCSFFGRLLSAAPDFLHEKMYFARTGWLAIAVVPTPIAFLLLTASGNGAVLHASTALIGLSSGFLVSAAVSITSELFGPNSAGINHNIVITNIPIGSLLYGLLAAIVYDDHAEKSSIKESLLGEASMCMGRQCYWETFMWWTCISLLGLISSFLLFLRTRTAYNQFENKRSQVPFS